MPPLFAQPIPYELIYIGAYLAWMGPEQIGNFFEMRTRRRREGEERNDGASGLLIMVGILFLPPISVAAAFVFRHRLLFQDAVPVFFAGIALMLCGVFLRWYSVHSLGRFFSRSVAIQQRHEIVSSGPYRLIRHPSYSGTMLTLVGIGLATDNWIALLVSAVGGFAAYAHRVSREERTLLGALGEPYREYMKRTRRFIPFVF